jgi:hypothetical protein
MVRIVLVTTPVAIARYAVGLPAGANGVAAGFSVDALEMRVLAAAKVRFRPQAWQDSDAETSG